MKYPRISLFVFMAVLLFASACKTFEVKNVNYAQQVESVLTPTDNGDVTDSRYGIAFNILPFQYEEMKDSSSVLVDEVRLIRNQNGFYFITADGFNNVYVMEPINSGLKLKEKINVTEQGLVSPAFNLRSPFVQLIDTATSETFTLNEKGIKKEESKS
ncbi:hypothetical protein A8B79_09765 [Balneola sp. EhC07]|jgi:hypothetical protein|uniref:hypothetical protein n=1 Tax=Balneola sp. EhC07 TaxID=1849360 RepID=UPI0007F4FD10|nr:hypothetical protein [Balneola sp. EhC07]MBO6572160.1 hypothetical protein [Balneola sp.]MBR9917062.1 hypothetical protein [bacterium]OAN60794.1 hypothetical protein A8B79_09765 [Balneola sp. EhC07]